MIVAKGNKVDSLYPLFVHKKEHLLAITNQPMTSIWHRRLGHMSRNGMEILSLYGHLPKFSFSDFAVFEHCQHGKQTRSAHKINVNSSTKPIDLVHIDICGPMPRRYFNGALYIVTFIDDVSRKVQVYPIKGNLTLLSENGLVWLSWKNFKIRTLDMTML